MRIAHVVSSYHPCLGGVETHVRRLAEGCAAAGDQMTVLTHQPGRSASADRIGAVRVLRFPMLVRSHNYPYSPGLSHYLKIHAPDFDLVHAHNYHTLAGHAAIGSGLPVVFTPHYHGTGHTPLAAVLHRLYRPIGGRQFSRAAAIICVSAAERSLVARNFPGADGKVVVIPNGADARRGPPDPAVAEDDWDFDDRPVVLVCGRLERHKNVDLVITAFRALASPALLVVAGDGPDRARLERHVQVSEPGWPVRFLGRVPDPLFDRLCARASVMTSASDHEAFGLAVAEGLASGARVVASAIPAHADVARLAGANAPVTLVDPRDEYQFTAALSASLGQGRPQVVQHELPSWAEVIESTRDLYSRICWRHAQRVAAETG